MQSTCMQDFLWNRITSKALFAEKQFTREHLLRRRNHSLSYSPCRAYSYRTVWCFSRENPINFIYYFVTHFANVKRNIKSASHKDDVENAFGRAIIDGNFKRSHAESFSLILYIHLEFSNPWYILRTIFWRFFSGISYLNSRSTGEWDWIHKSCSPYLLFNNTN
jgi:hypothetical protein